MQIGDLMVETGVKFGTSGARGLAEDMTDWVCYAYSLGFLGYLRDAGLLAVGQRVGIAGDLRPSTPRIMTACAKAARDFGCLPVNLGRTPSPALAAYGIEHGIPTCMVTGSHIPDDRNGIKFNLPTGEILKRDEEGIRGQHVTRPEALFRADGSFAASQSEALPPPVTDAYELFVARYLDFFTRDCLRGLTVGVYEHSSVAREPFVDVLSGLGAEVVRLGFSDRFIPVDTEAIRPEDVELARAWAAGGELDAIVSADGDGDRPLVADERGRWLRGDIAGVLCARELGARGVVTPVSSNTAVEKCGCFQAVARTRIGSPFVIEGMQTLVAEGLSPVVGYEANGGFLLATALELDGCVLPALPTRDAVIVAVAILRAAARQGKPVSALADDLPRRFTHSDRLKDFPTPVSQSRIADLNSGRFADDKAALEALFAADFGEVAAIDATDGLRVTFASGEIVHLRPSGNAPELRAYTEADTPERAADMARICLEHLSAWRD